MATSVDGLVSGMSTSQVISQLMQVEAAGQNRIKTQLKSEQTVQGIYRTVNTKLAGLESAADVLTQPDTWKAVKASSSSTAVTASASAGAATGSMTFDVTRLAKAHMVTMVVPDAGPIAAGGSIDITVGSGSPVAVNVTTNTPQGVVDAINGAGLDVRAAVLSTEDGTVIQLTSTKTGGDAAFTLDGLDLAVEPKVAVQGVDAQVRVGDDGAPGAYTVTSATNTFTNVLSGVTITATKVESDVTVSVVADAEGLASKVKAMVDAANGVLTEISNQTGYDAASKKAGPLLGNFMLRKIDSDLLSTVGSGKEGYGSFKQFGVQLDDKGKLTFDRERFIAAYQADPAAVKAAVQTVQTTPPAAPVPTGLAASLEEVAKAAQVNVTAVTQASDNKQRDLNDQILRWDTRLKLRQDALQRQFANLEVALGKMKEQSNWLAGQLSGLAGG